MARNNGGPGITLVIRKISSGYKVVALQGEDMNHLYSIARILIRSPEYQNCYAVGSDWSGNQLFNVQPEQVYQAPAPYQAPQQYPSQYPQVGYPPPPGYPALPQYPQQAQPGNPYPQPPAYPPSYPPPGYQVVETYVEGPAPSPYGVYPALPGRR